MEHPRSPVVSDKQPVRRHCPSAPTRLFLSEEAQRPPSRPSARLQTSTYSSSSGAKTVIATPPSSSGREVPQTPFNLPITTNWGWRPARSPDRQATPYIIVHSAGTVRANNGPNSLGSSARKLVTQADDFTNVTEEQWREFDASVARLKKEAADLRNLISTARSELEAKKSPLKSSRSARISSSTTSLDERSRYCSWAIPGFSKSMVLDSTDASAMSARRATSPPSYWRVAHASSFTVRGAIARSPRPWPPQRATLPVTATEAKNHSRYDGEKKEVAHSNENRAGALNLQNLRLAGC